VVLVVEHESSRSGRWLRVRRTRLALWIAVFEAALVVFGVIPRWPAFVVALGLLASYVLVGRRVRSDIVRHISWIGAVSQLLIVALPALLAVVTFVAVIVVAILAAVALTFLFLDRR